MFIYLLHYLAKPHTDESKSFIDDHLGHSSTPFNSNHRPSLKTLESSNSKLVNSAISSLMDGFQSPSATHSKFSSHIYNPNPSSFFHHNEPMSHHDPFIHMIIKKLTNIPSKMIQRESFYGIPLSSKAYKSSKTILTHLYDSAQTSVCTNRSTTRQALKEWMNHGLNGSNARKFLHMTHSINPNVSSVSTTQPLNKHSSTSNLSNPHWQQTASYKSTSSSFMEGSQNMINPTVASETPLSKDTRSNPKKRKTSIDIPPSIYPISVESPSKTSQSKVLNLFSYELIFMVLLFLLSILFIYFYIEIKIDAQCFSEIQNKCFFI